MAGITDKEHYTSLAIDGMDKAKTELPSVPRRSKQEDNIPRFKLNVNGVLSRGSSSAPATVLLSDSSVPNNANFACMV